MTLKSMSSLRRRRKIGIGAERVESEGIHRAGNRAKTRSCSLMNEQS